MQLTAAIRGNSLAAFAERMKLLGNDGRAILSQTLNAAGHRVRQDTVRAETAQTGLRQGTIDRAQRETPSSAATLDWRINARGGDINLKYLGAKEVAGGVMAMPLGRSTFFAGAFLTSGPPGNRQPASRLNGHVFVNVAGGDWHGKIQKQGSGVVIPREMTQGKTLAAFEAGAEGALGVVVRRLGTMIG